MSGIRTKTAARRGASDHAPQHSAADHAPQKQASARATRPARKKGPIERLHPWAQQVRAWFFSSAPSALLAWFAIQAILVAILVWFFLFSPYGVPAGPIYAGF